MLSTLIAFVARTSPPPPVSRFPDNFGGKKRVRVQNISVSALTEARSLGVLMLQYWPGNIQTWYRGRHKIEARYEIYLCTPYLDFGRSVPLAHATDQAEC